MEPQEKADGQTEIYLDSLFRNSPEAIVLMDNKNRVIRINEEFTRLFGYAQKEILGSHIDNLISGPETKEEAEKFSRLAEKGERINKESIRYRKNGKPVHVSILGAPVEVDDKIIGIFGIYRDISKRKKVEEKLSLSERRYRSLIEKAPIGIFQSSSKGYFLNANNKTADILGFDTVEGVLSFYEDLSRQLYTDPSWRETFLATLQEHGEAENFEVPAKRRDGLTIWLTINARVSEYRDNGEFIIDGFLSDTTEFKHASEQIEKSLKDKEVLLQEVHHRVKNNMQIISSILNLEADEVKNPQMEEVLIKSQSRIRTMSLIHEKLYHSEDVTLVDLKDYTENLCREIINFTTLDERNHHSLYFNLEEIYTGIDFAIPFGLILNELLLNSFKLAFEGVESPAVTVELRQKEGKIELKISDNGVGIPHHIDFTKAETLGIRLIRSLTDQLRGEIHLEHKEGTVYTFLFPLP